MHTEHVIFLILLIIIGLYLLLSFANYYVRFRREHFHIPIRIELNKLNIGFARTKFRHTYKTPGGACVSSTVDVPFTALSDIDAGIKEQIKRNAILHPDWMLHSSPSDYRIVFINPSDVNEDNFKGSPALTIAGKICAGTVLFAYPRCSENLPVIVLPHQKFTGWRDADYLIRSVWYLSEHVREALNDYTAFQEHLLQGNDKHPRGHNGCYDLPIYDAEGKHQIDAMRVFQGNDKFVCGLSALVSEAQDEPAENTDKRQASQEK